MEAIKGKKDFRTVLKAIDIDVDSKVAMAGYVGAISAENTNKVLNNAVAIISKLGISSIEVYMEMVDNPMIQCAQQCE